MRTLIHCAPRCRSRHLPRAERLRGATRLRWTLRRASFDSDVVEAQLARNTEAKAPAARRGDAAPAWKDDKIRGIYNRADHWTNTRTFNAAFGRVASTACATVRPPSCCTDRLACSRFDPWQRSVIFIHAVEVDHGLASHLVGPDPLVGDQLISLSLSEFAIAATVLELDEPAPLVVIVVNHDSCMCSDDLRHNWIKAR